MKNIYRKFSRFSIVALAIVLLLLTAIPVISAANAPIISVDFEDGTISGFDVRGTEGERENNGTGILTVSTDVARSGDYSLLITERKNAWNGIAFNILPHVKPGVTYEITFWVHAKTPDTSEFMLSTQVGTGAGASYTNLTSKSISIDNAWVEMKGEFSYSQVDIDSGHITVYIENKDKEAEFYVDDFSLTALDGGAARDPLTDPITADSRSSEKRGNFMGFDFEFWSEKNDGTTIMQLTGPGTFTCSWDSALNILFRTGRKLGSVNSYEEYGDITIDYTATHNIESGDVSYLTAYGWIENGHINNDDPNWLVEWYVVENHGSYRPPGGGTKQGTVEIDGLTYEVRTAVRRSQPSIKGTATFLQIFSVLAVGQQRTEGVINLTDHFKAWEALDLDVSGKLYEVSMCIEAYGTSGRGNGEISKHILTIGDTVYGLGPEPVPLPKPEEPPEATPEQPQEPENPTPPPDEPSGDGFPEWGIILIFAGVSTVAIVGAVIIRKKR